MFAIPRMLPAALLAAASFLLISLPVQAENGVTDTAIILGQTAGLTGQVAGPVKELNEGANAYIQFVNQRGGVHGRKIEIRSLDDKFDPALAAQNAETLIKKEQVFALFQNRGTPHTEALLPIMMANSVPLIGPSTGAALLHAPVNKYVFNVRAKYQDEVIKAVEHFATLGMQQISLIHVDDSFGGDALAGFKTAMATQKLTPTAIIKFDRVKPDIATAVAAAAKGSPRAVIIAASAPTTIDLIKALRAAGNQAQIMTLSNNSSQAFVKKLGTDGVGIIVSQITPAPHLVSSKLGQEFNAAAKESGATISYAAMEGFVAAKVLVEGLQRAGRNLTRESLIRGLETINKQDFGGLMLGYSPTDHTGSEFVELTMIGKNGAFIR